MRTLAIAAAFALAACGQATAPAEPEAPAAPLSLMEQAMAQSPENRPVFAWQQLTAYQATHPEAVPPCASIRGAESRGVVPDNVAADSIYAAHKGSLVFSVQCGPQLTTVRDEPREHWLVVLAPGATEAVVVNCANAAGRDQCPRAIPTAAAATTP
ncbi:hypothetical protein U91I_01530 [alpha proteobacterium U9-1i]|nr:hypothetical protein U91I_01530 [alpha proteobacterium U9-1i]